MRESRLSGSSLRARAELERALAGATGICGSAQMPMWLGQFASDGKGVALHCRWERIGNDFPMQAKIDSVGRIVLPKPLRDALGLKAGSAVDISVYGRGLQLVPESRAARIVERNGRWVAVSATKVSDQDVFGLIDEDRRR